ncbi:MAG: hypothetical protein HC901_01790 [Bdellovibrionaceae bacterium]|nr:hypothetical protein [Pseudobdellovibrionaceae bacterium]
MSRVPSLFSPDYLHASRAFIRALTAGVDHRQFLWFETTVEPQFMGSRWVDYGPDARHAYLAWLKDNDLSGPLIPDSFPIPEAFLRDPTWNRFRAQWLAGWVNNDAQAFRDIAGPGAWVAIDYLDANEMTQRCGDPVEFLRHLSCPDIIQVNWTWDNILRAPNHKAYQRVRQVMAETGREWAITEHMTINGTDYHAHEMESLLENTLAQGTQFGWEFVDIARNLDCESIKPGTVQPGAFKPCHFSVYDRQWNPKPPMDVVDSKWAHWLEKIYNP